VGQISTKESYLWYNKEIQIDSKPILYKAFQDNGINLIKDHLMNSNGKVKIFKDLGLDQKEWQLVSN
jgi:hypothetical protein